MVGRVCPRHGHRGRPLNSVVRRHLSRRGHIIAAVATTAVVVIALFVFVANWRPSDYHTPAYNMRFKVPIYAEMVESYRAEKGHYPTSAEGLEQLVRDGFIREVPRDDWGNALQYRYPSPRPEVPFELCSLGADGMVGGEGTNADICNWSRRK